MKIYVYDRNMNFIAVGTSEFMTDYVDQFIEDGYVVTRFKMVDEKQTKIKQSGSFDDLFMHWNKYDPKSFVVKCTGDDCPICEAGLPSTKTKTPMPETKSPKKDEVCPICKIPNCVLYGGSGVEPKEECPTCAAGDFCSECN